MRGTRCFEFYFLVDFTNRIRPVLVYVEGKNVANSKVRT